MNYFDYLKEREYDFVVVKFPFIDLSSRVIRSRFKKGKPITGLLPQNVIEYIRENGLYLPKPEDEENADNKEKKNEEEQKPNKLL